MQIGKHMAGGDINLIGKNYSNHYRRTIWECPQPRDIDYDWKHEFRSLTRLTLSIQLHAVLDQKLGQLAHLRFCLCRTAMPPFRRALRFKQGSRTVDNV